MDAIHQERSPTPRIDPHMKEVALKIQSDTEFGSKTETNDQL